MLETKTIKMAKILVVVVRPDHQKVMVNGLEMLCKCYHFLLRPSLNITDKRTALKREKCKKKNLLKKIKMEDDMMKTEEEEDFKSTPFPPPPPD